MEKIMSIDLEKQEKKQQQREKDIQNLKTFFNTYMAKKPKEAKKQKNVVAAVKAMLKASTESMWEPYGGGRADLSDSLDNILLKVSDKTDPYTTLTVSFLIAHENVDLDLMWSVKDNALFKMLNLADKVHPEYGTLAAAYVEKSKFFEPETEVRVRRKAAKLKAHLQKKLEGQS
jgi:hypothetical protein